MQDHQLKLELIIIMMKSRLAFLITVVASNRNPTCKTKLFKATQRPYGPYNAVVGLEVKELLRALSPRFLFLGLVCM